MKKTRRFLTLEEERIALVMLVELDLQRSVEAAMAQLHENDRQSFIRMFYQSYGLTLLTFNIAQPIS